MNSFTLESKSFSADKIMRILFDRMIILILFLIFVAATLISEYFLTARNLLNVLRQVCTSAILCCGYTCLIGSGHFDLSVGYLLGLVGVVVAKVSLIPGMNPFVAMFVGIIVGVLCGLLNGITVTYMKMPVFIATMATGQLYRGVNYLLCNSSPVIGLPEVFKTIGQGEWLGVPILVYVVVVVAIIIYIILDKSAFGRYMLAVGGNADAATVCGINVTKVKLSVFMLLGACVALAGIMTDCRAYSAQPIAGQGMEMDAIAAVVIGGTPQSGGKATVIGSLFGCAVVGIIVNVLNLAGVDTNWQYIVKGAIIFLAMFFDVQKDRISALQFKKAK